MTWRDFYEIHTFFRGPANEVLPTGPKPFLPVWMLTVSQLTHTATQCAMKRLSEAFHFFVHWNRTFKDLIVLSSFVKRQEPHDACVAKAM